MKKLVLIFLIAISQIAFSQWEPLDGPIGDTNAVTIVCGNKLAFCTSGPYVYRSLFKITGNKLTLIDNSALKGLGVVCASKKDYIWAFVKSPIPQGYYLSIDSGLTFTYYSIYRPFPIAENSKHELYVSRGNIILKSSDQINWVEVQINFEPNYTVSSFVNNSDEIILLGNRSDTINIIKLDPITYTEIFNKKIHLSRIFNELLISRDDSYYVMSDTAVYKSIDEGSAFTQILSASTGRVFRMMIEVNNTLFMATNQGVLTSSNKGKTWTDDNSGLNSYDCWSLGKTGDNTIYLGLARDVVYRNVKYTDVEEKPIPEHFLTPNPTTDYIEITCRGEVTSPLQSEIKIYNVFGQSITTVNLTPTLSILGEGVRLDVSALVPGMYFVRVGDRVGKFVKL